MERTCETCKWGYDSHPDEPCKWCEQADPTEWVSKEDTITIPRERLREALVKARLSVLRQDVHLPIGELTRRKNEAEKYADRILAELEGERND